MIIIWTLPIHLSIHQTKMLTTTIAPCVFLDYFNEGIPYMLWLLWWDSYPDRARQDGKYYLHQVIQYGGQHQFIGECRGIRLSNFEQILEEVSHRRLFSDSNSNRCWEIKNCYRPWPLHNFCTNRSEPRRSHWPLQNVRRICHGCRWDWGQHHSSIECKSCIRFFRHFVRGTSKLYALESFLIRLRAYWPQ